MRARFGEVSPALSVPRSARYTLTCRVENTGHARWPRSSPDGFGLVRLGAHLHAGDGAPDILDYGRADLPRDVEPGAAEVLSIELEAPGRPGRYRVTLDMVREGVTWFSRRVPCSVEVGLTVI